MAVAAKKTAASRKPAGLQVTMDFKKETSNYYVFEESGNDRVTTGSLYFRKDQFGDKQPTSIVLAVSPTY